MVDHEPPVMKANREKQEGGKGISGTPNLLEKVFERVREVRTPIQLISFALAAILAVALLRADVTINALILFVLLLPFILLILVVNNRILNSIKQGGNVVVATVCLLILGLFIFSAYSLIALIDLSRGGLVNTSNLSIITPAKKERVEDVKNVNFRINSYIDNYRMLSSYYHESVLDCLNNNNADAYQTVILLRGEMDSVTGRIVNLKESNVKTVYGNQQIAGEVKKLQETILVLDFTRYLWEVVENVYGSKGHTYSIDEIIPTTGWNIPKEQLTSLRRVEFSEVESDFIRALGRDIVLKPINGFTVQDISTIKKGLASLGYLSSQANARADAEILQRYNSIIGQYYSDTELSKPFYQLSELGMSKQIPIYLALHETGLLDFKAFIIKNSPPNAKNMMSDLLDKKLELFNLGNLDKLTELMIRYQSDRNNVSQSVQLTFKLRDRIKNKIGNSPEAQEILKSETVEEYFVRSLKLMLRPARQGETDRDLFLTVNFSKFENTDDMCAYGRMLQEFLSYYNVFETNLVISSIDS